MAQQISAFFDKFSKDYDTSAFKQSVGLEYISKLETDFILQNCPVKKGDRVLDIGIGTGRNADILLKKEAIIEGIDISEGMMEEAKRKFKGGRVNFTVADAGKKIPFKSDSFDYVICMRVLKYIPTWKKTIEEVSRVLKKDGIFILEIQNKSSIAYFGLKSANYFLFRIKEVKNCLRRLDFRIIKSKGGTRLPFRLYKNIKNKILLILTKSFEWVISKILPSEYLSRNV